jgi:hypothetical protein
MLHVKKIIDVFQPTILQSIEQSKNHLKYNMSIKLLKNFFEGFSKNMGISKYLLFF